MCMPARLKKSPSGKLNETGSLKLGKKFANVGLGLGLGDVKQTLNLGTDFAKSTLFAHQPPDMLTHLVQGKNLLHVSQLSADGNNDRLSRDPARQEIGGLPV